MYVKPKNFKEIKNDINENYVVTITGPPGIGKSWTAAFLLYISRRKFGNEYKSYFIPRWDLERKIGSKYFDTVIKKQKSHLSKFLFLFDEPFREDGGILKNFNSTLEILLRTGYCKIILTCERTAFESWGTSAFCRDLDKKGRIKVVNLDIDSYGVAELKCILENYVNRYNPAWGQDDYFDELKEMILKKYVTPHSIALFVKETKRKKNQEVLVRELDEIRDIRLNVANMVEHFMNNEQEHLVEFLLLSAIRTDSPFDFKKVFLKPSLPKRDKRKQEYRKASSLFSNYVNDRNFYRHKSYYSGVIFSLNNTGVLTKFKDLMSSYSKDDDKYLRKAVAISVCKNLGNLPEVSKRFIDIIRKLAKDDEEIVRIAVAEGIFRNMDSKIMLENFSDIIKIFAEDKSPEVRLTTGVNLILNKERFEGEDLFLEIVERLAKDENENVRLAMAWEIIDNTMLDDRFLSIIKELSTDPNWKVRGTVGVHLLKNLNKITSEGSDEFRVDLSNLVTALLNDEDDRVRRALLTELTYHFEKSNDVFLDIIEDFLGCNPDLLLTDIIISIIDNIEKFNDKYKEIVTDFWDTITTKTKKFIEIGLIYAYIKRKQDYFKPGFIIRIDEFWKKPRITREVGVNYGNVMSEIVEIMDIGIEEIRLAMVIEQIVDKETEEEKVEEGLDLIRDYLVEYEGNARAFLLYCIAVYQKRFPREFIEEVREMVMEGRIKVDMRDLEIRGLPERMIKMIKKLLDVLD